MVMKFHNFDIFYNLLNKIHLSYCTSALACRVGRVENINAGPGVTTAQLYNFFTKVSGNTRPGFEHISEVGSII